MKNRNVPQIKICGLTNAKEAVECSTLGIQAIGLVFFDKSPRNVSKSTAKEICASLPSMIKKTGVFVNTGYSDIMRAVEYCGLDAVQLHGKESPEFVKRFMDQKLIVVKALFMRNKPGIEDASMYDASAVLVEPGGEKLPGGNAIPWDWSRARVYGENLPLILAGGLSPVNIATALKVCDPDAVDVSSGVESSPGRKDIKKVKLFVDRVLKGGSEKKLKKIF